MSLAAITGIRTAVRRITIATGMLGLLVVVAPVTLQIIARSLFGISITGVSEVTVNYGMVLLVFAGLAVAQDRNEHLRVTLLPENLGDQGRRISEIFALALVLVICIAISWFGLEAALIAFREGEYAIDSGMPVWPSRFVVPLTVMCMAALLVLQIFELLASRYGQQGTTADWEELPSHD